MKTFRLFLGISAIMFAVAGMSQDKYMPYLQKLALKNDAGQLKTGVVGSYPQHAEEFNWTTDWVAYRTIDINYNSNGDPTVIEYNQAGKRTRDLFSYNSQHQATEIINQSMVSGNWVNQTRQSTTFDNNGFETESRSEDWSGTAWVLTGGSQISYEFDGNRVKVLTAKDWKPETSTWVNSMRETYTYTGADAHFASVIMDKWTTTWVPNIKMDYTWNGNVFTEVQNSTYVGSAWVIQGKTAYEISALSTVMTQYQYSDGTFTAFTRTTITRDSHGNTTLSQMEMYAGAWAVFQATRYQLTYSGNNLTQRITQTTSIGTPGVWTNTFKEVFSSFASLSTDVTPLGVSGISIFPNPAGKDAVVRLRLLKAGEVTLSLISMTGQSVLEKTFTTNGSDVNYQLSLEKVRPGSYILIAHDKAGVELGKTRLIRE